MIACQPAAATLPLGDSSRRAIFPRGRSIDQLIRPVPPSPSQSGDGVGASAAAPAPLLAGATEQPGAAAALSSSERTRMVEAIGLIFAQRQRQLDYGHTLDRDIGREDGERRLLGKAIREASYTRENVTLRVGGADWTRFAADRAAKAAALLLAFIELMLERQAQQQLEPEPAPIEQGELGL